MLQKELHIVVLFAAMLSVASPQQMTLMDLQQMCIEGGPKDACRFYILGAMEGIGLAAGVANDKSHFCIPENLTQETVVTVVRKWAAADLLAYPQDKDIPAVSFIGAALIKEYPCRIR